MADIWRSGREERAGSFTAVVTPLVGCAGSVGWGSFTREFSEAEDDDFGGGVTLLKRDEHCYLNHASR